MTFDPRSVPDPERALAEIATALHLGSGAFRQRLDELAGGYPSAGEGAPGNAANGGPTLAAVIANLDEHRTDVADVERAAYERDLRKALEHAAAMWARYQRVTNTRLGVDKITDPGCELCAKVPCGGSLCDKPKGTSSYRCETVDAHWCPVYATVELREESRRKGQPDSLRKVALCSSCFEFNRPSRAGRLPTHDEVLDHVQGRRRRWRAS
jgi:hypothetical protein